MGKQITITLEQLKSFISQPEHNKSIMLQSAIRPLHTTFNRKIFTHHADTKKIETKRELHVLIAKGGRSHKPARPRPADPYNNEYLTRKVKYMGETRPHVYENYGFLHGTSLNIQGIRLVLKTRPIFKKGFNYLEFHERNRSVLKLTFLRAWQNIIDNMINALAKEAKRL